MGWTLDRIKARIGELEESTKEFTQKAAWRDKRLREERENEREGERENENMHVADLQDILRGSNICLLGIWEKDNERHDGEAKCEDLGVENFPYIMKDTTLQILWAGPSFWICRIQKKFLRFAPLPKCRLFTKQSH